MIPNLQNAHFTPTFSRTFQTIAMVILKSMVYTQDGFTKMDPVTVTWGLASGGSGNSDGSGSDGGIFAWSVRSGGSDGGGLGGSAESGDVGESGGGASVFSCFGGLGIKSLATIPKILNTTTIARSV